MRFPSGHSRALFIRCSLGCAVLAGLSALSGCGGSSNNSTSTAPTAPITPPATTANPLSQVVFLGDSLTAGYQNGSLLDSQQKNGWAALVAQQGNFPITLPLVAAPGVPAVEQLVQASFPPILDTASGTSAGRENQSVQATDLAVPGFDLSNLLVATPEANPTDVNSLQTKIVLGYPAGATGTALTQGLALKPSTLYVWIGNVDALSVDAAADPSQMTPVSTFTTEFAQLLSTIKASSTAHLIVGNIPDVTEIPYLTPASEILSLLSQQTGFSVDQLSTALNLHAGELLNQTGLSALYQEFSATSQTPGPLPASGVLTTDEIATAQATVNAYNQVIAQQVAAAGGTVVDVHALIDSLATSGMTINGYAATTRYLGGFFGLDGIHPSNTGYALIANAFITATNTALGTTIPQVDVTAVAAKDPYFGSNRTGSTLPYLALPSAKQAAARRVVDASIFGSHLGSASATHAGR